jgi:AcrR family transcriptional regulator
MTALPAAASGTRLRLLEAAGDVFAERGFRDATVREIVARARANVAAVNYHFRDKAGLYGAVLEHFARESARRHPPQQGLPAGASAEDRLRAFVLALLKRTFDEGHQAVHGKLMSREMVEPTAALVPIVRDVIRPMYDRLRGIVRELLGPGASDRRVRLAAKSVVGQCLFYKHCAAVIERLEGPLPRGPAAVAALADHVADFSLAALRKGGRR